MNAPLFVELVLGPTRGPAWIVDAIAAIEATGDAVLLSTRSDGGPPAVAGRGVRILLRGYGRIDRRLFGLPDDPDRYVDLTPAIERLAATPARGRSPDVVIRFDGHGRGPAGAARPRFGTWTIHHGAGLSAAERAAPVDLPPGGRELLFDHSLVISQLVADTGAGRLVIGQVASRADPLSICRGSRGHLKALPGLLARAVTSVRLDGELHATVAAPMGTAMTAAVHPVARRLGWGTVSLRLAGILAGFVGRLVSRHLRPERWVVAVARDRTGIRDLDARPVRILQAPDDREWADPFPVRTASADLLFVEEYVRSAQRGRLSVVELDESARGWRSVEPILELPTHVSYPFVFEWSGQWYLLPEQAGTEALQLYVAERFPTTWRRHSTLLDLPAADATIAEIDGRWWMFAALAGPGALAADELHLFHATTPLGPWVPHARNPVLVDVRSARPAGRMYRRDDCWYRVAQDGAVSYGHSITIARIDRLDPDGYAETVVDVIRPDWAPGLVATHTLNVDAGLMAIDARRPELRFRRPGRGRRTRPS